VTCACTQGTLGPLTGVMALATAGVRVTPEMQRWAASYAYNCAIPIGNVYKRWFGTTPVVARVECHSARWEADGTKTPGNYHGVTLYYPTNASMLPPASGIPTSQQILRHEQQQEKREDQSVLIALLLFGGGAAVTWWWVHR
jgi:hypothetical protein